MEDFFSSDEEDIHYTDRDPLDGIENDDALEARTKSSGQENRSSSSSQSSGSSHSIDEIGCSTRKRARKEALGDSRFDLNMPAEVVDKS